jgi:hypothetical protein
LVKKKNRFLMIGPPTENPYCSLRSLPEESPAANGDLAAKNSLRLK